ncbi:hypothetical protein ASPZODRAFT_1565707 [Penicilliopsis zonata CBS 506.65]|uniref:Uncharacterized protein n=1 Tax=Penicilliopsis zonata CBS 506.65 TaxID=1073090 RepID=A0A1L9SMQ5_9EURO|nr:hypothetical protein ASPZODRAFT_1565707 [Penicilliopsis zonata CBS 506.65]OJJ48334.1 hypothetical protein ASPZODRAFT_1565707 [Penicilliopsis zonata CBS 506.65]
MNGTRSYLRRLTAGTRRPHLVLAVDDQRAQGALSATASQGSCRSYPQSILLSQPQKIDTHTHTACRSKTRRLRKSNNRGGRVAERRGEFLAGCLGGGGGTFSRLRDEKHGGGGQYGGPGVHLRLNKLQVTTSPTRYLTHQLPVNNRTGSSSSVYFRSFGVLSRRLLDRRGTAAISISACRWTCLFA